MYDSNFSNVSLLLRPDYVFGVLWDVLDKGRYGRSLNRTGVSVAPGSNPSTIRTNYGDMSFNGTNSSITYDLLGDTTQDVGTNDFTLEFWIKTSDTTATIYESYISAGVGPTITISGGKVVFSEGGTDSIITGAIPVNTNTWYHVAVARSSGVTYLYINGVYDGSAADTANIVGLGTVYIGKNRTSSAPSYYNGLISDCRVTSNVARYSGTSNISPPTTSFDLGIINDANWDSTSILIHAGPNKLAPYSTNEIRDSSKRPKGLLYNIPLAALPTTVGKTQTGAVHFPNSGYISTPQHPDFNLSTGDFSLEFWMYPQANARGVYTNLAVVACFGELGVGNVFVLYYPTSSMMLSLGSADSFGTITNIISSTTATTALTWSKVAMIRTAGVINVYLNGVLNFTTSTVCDIDGSTFSLGTFWMGTQHYFYGSLQEIRLIKGVSIGNVLPVRATIYSDEAQGSPISIQDAYLSGKNPCSNYTPNHLAINDINSTSIHQQAIPWYDGGSRFIEGRLLSHTDIHGSITGTVNTNGIASPNVKVFLYYRPTGRLLATRFTNGLGQFVFSDMALSKIRSDYFVTAMSDTYRAVITDNVLPT
jgi:hypothetical protein